MVPLEQNVAFGYYKRAPSIVCALDRSSDEWYAVDV